LGWENRHGLTAEEEKEGGGRIQLGFLTGPSLSPVMKLPTPLTITLIPENHVDLSRSPFVGVEQFVQLCGLLSQYIYKHHRIIMGQTLWFHPQ
jgi:hypothetical protein